MQPDEVNNERTFWQAAVHEMQENNRRLKAIDGRLWWVLLLLLINALVIAL